MLEVRKEFKWNKIGSWSFCNPFTIMFIYPANEKGFIIKGGLRDCEDWVEDNMADKNYVMNYRMFHNHECRGSWKVNLVKGKCYIMRNFDGKKRIKGYQIQVYVDNLLKPNFTKIVRRIPRCFPKELLPYC